MEKVILLPTLNNKIETKIIKNNLEKELIELKSKFNNTIE
jgi:hypothetical protein